MTEGTTSDQWWHAYSTALHPAYRSLIEAEQTAAVVQCFSFTVLPGLVQTEGYTRAATVGSHLLPLSRKECELFSTLRLDRQWHLFEQSEPPQLEVLIDESTLYRRVGSAQILCEQLRHLIRLAQLPYITIRILPLSRPIDYSGDYGLHNFIILKSKESEGYSLYREQSSAPTQTFTNVSTEIHRYQLLFSHLWQEARSAKKSVALIESILTTLARVTGI